MDDSFGDYVYEGGEPRWRGDGGDEKKILEARRIVAAGSQQGFAGFYQWASPRLQERLEAQRRYARSERQRYDGLMAAYNARISQMVAEADARRKADEAERDAADVDNMGVPTYRYTSDWGHSLWELVTLDWESRDVYFPDIDKSGSIARSPKGDSYYSKAADYCYKTTTDAIIAEYAYLKYGKIRKKGRY